MYRPMIHPEWELWLDGFLSNIGEIFWGEGKDWKWILARDREM
jgi:hypothetical protein